jgi:hypothetical protein
MPRKPKLGRQFAGQPAPAQTRETVVAALQADPFGLLQDGVEHPLLAAFPPAEREAIVAEVERRQWAEREAQREPVLLERLRTWPVMQLGTIFSERPDLEKRLTPERRAEWHAWVKAYRREIGLDE